MLVAGLVRRAAIPGVLSTETSSYLGHNTCVCGCSDSPRIDQTLECFYWAMTRLQPSWHARELAASKTLGIESAKQPFEYPSVRYWSKEINGILPGGRKTLFSNSRRSGRGRHMAAASMESCQSVAQRPPGGRIGDIIYTRKRLHRMRPGSGHNRPILSPLQLIKRDRALPAHAPRPQDVL